MVGDDTATGADWVSSCAVRAEDRRVAIKTCEVLGTTGVLLLVSAVKDVVWLVGSVHNVTPEKGSSNYMMLVRRTTFFIITRHLLALPVAELLSRPLETKVHPPGPPRTSPTT